MVVTMRGVCVLAITILVVISPVFGDHTPDGLPRPSGYPVTPTMAYGALPTIVDRTTNTAADCEWYGFAHILYPAKGAQCLVTTRLVLANETIVAMMTPYRYYYLTSFVFDTTTNSSYCLYGCFRIDSTAATPPPGFAPPPLEDPAAPPPALEPPPVGTPPPVSVSPPPVEDPAIPPPALLAPPTIPPPTDLTTPPGALEPPTDQTPPPPGVFSLSAAGLVRPVTSFLSLVVSGALLVLNFLL